MINEEKQMLRDLNSVHDDLYYSAVRHLLRRMPRIVRRAGRLVVMAAFSMVFVSMAQAQAAEPQATSEALASWAYRKPPRDVPLRVGVLPPEAIMPYIYPGRKMPDSICNRIWQDQSDSYERPFAVTYVSDRRVSETRALPGVFALDNYILPSQNDFARLQTAKEYGKGERGFFNATQEAVLLVDHEQETGVGNIYWALYLKKINAVKCENKKLSECKRFEAQAELYEFKLDSWPNDFLRKADIGKVHIDSRCVGQQYLYHREPFLGRPGLIERFLPLLRND